MATESTGQNHVGESVFGTHEPRTTQSTGITSATDRQSPSTESVGPTADLLGTGRRGGPPTVWDHWPALRERPHGMPWPPQPAAGGLPNGSRPRRSAAAA